MPRYEVRLKRRGLRRPRTEVVEADRLGLPCDESGPLMFHNLLDGSVVVESVLVAIYAPGSWDRVRRLEVAA